MSPQRKTKVANEIIERLKVSERRICNALHLNRTVKRYKPKRADDEEFLKKDIIRLAERHPRYGYRRIAAMLKTEGWRVNIKRIQRTWRELDLRVPKKQKKRGRIHLSDGSCISLKPLYQNHVWSYDFVEDRTPDGRKYKCLTIMDEFTKESLKIKVKRSMKSQDVLEALSELFLSKGIPDLSEVIMSLSLSRMP